MKIKVIIRNGVIEAVLGDDEAQQNAEVEIVDNNDDYEDADKLAEYTDQLYDADGMNDVPFTIAHFQDC